ncbi:hypothetical protein J8L85_07265 [Maribacter sp. MMG018]|uniref:hypothetical protein n=1 Tax=Maribacter sp. MMG018 TaxID=2822688 RepID=UPI001B36B238|nr:hypothetical protein [Maribacter sp. MMG018]MBQ4914229.1 hypothetical protein [Maribacter sp. MMG018]
MKNRYSYALLALMAFMVFSCNEKQKPKPEKVKAEVKTANNPAMVPPAWIRKRVEKAQKELLKTEAGSILWKGMEAHGGLATWFGNGALSFRFKYMPLDGGTVRDSYQTINTWSNKARHYSVKDSTDQFGWTGEKAWIKTKDSTSFAYDTKFWALTPIYLMGHPFVLDGEGVNLELLPQTEFKGKTNDVVKVTFAAGTGDAPDDYYILQFDAESHLLTATRYIVSYPEYFKDGGHAPEKIMEVGELVSVDGVLLPNSLKTHWLSDEGGLGEHITTIEITDISFVKELPEDFYEVPESAKILE